MQMEHYCPQIQVKRSKKRSSTRIEHLFSPNLRSDVHPFKSLGGMQMWTILKVLGGIQPNYWGMYPPLVSAPLAVGSDFFKHEIVVIAMKSVRIVQLLSSGAVR